MFDFVALGAYTKDTIVSARGVRKVDGGGFNYAAHAALRAGLNVAAITRLADEDRGIVEPLERAGVAVFVHASARSTHMRLHYPNDNPDERLLSVASVVDPFSPEDVAGIEARAFLVTASIRGEAPVSLLRAITAKGDLLGIDVQGFVRVVGDNGALRYAEWPERREALPLVDILKTDAVEAEFLTRRSDIREAARALADEGAREIVLTHKDGLLVFADGRFHEAPFKPRELRGRSGRGDTCVGAYMSKRLDAPPEQATRWAAALTSLKLEAEGPITRSADDVRAFLESAY